MGRNALAEFGRGAGAAVAVGFSVVIATAVLITRHRRGVQFRRRGLGLDGSGHGGIQTCARFAAVWTFPRRHWRGGRDYRFRFVISDRDKRFLRKSFALYLAPALIEKMVSSKKPPELGGERAM